MEIPIEFVESEGRSTKSWLENECKLQDLLHNSEHPMSRMDPLVVGCFYLKAHCFFFIIR